MNTTQRILAGWIAVAVCISTGLATAGLPDGMASVLVGGAVVGQQDAPRSPAVGTSVQAGPADPFVAGRGNANAASGQDANGVNRLPPTGSPASTGVPAPVSGSNDRVHSDAMLRGARLALAVGDVRRAGDMLGQAKREQIRYAPNEDSPERVEAAIARYQEVSRLDHASEDNRKTYARMLMEQSEVLLQWGEYAQADQLAALAAQQQVAYGPFEAKPEDLLKRIAGLRQQANPAGPPVVADAHKAASSIGPSLAARQKAIDLMHQTREALTANQIDRAESLARQLDRLQIPEAAFEAGQDHPSLVFQAVHAAMSQNRSGVVQAGGSVNVAQPVNSAVYDPSRDSSRNLRVADQQPTEPVPLPPGIGGASPAAAAPSQGYGLFQQGEAALKARDHDRALQLFQQAAGYMTELDPVTAARLQDHLSLLSAPKNPSARANAATSPVDETVLKQQALLREMFNEVGHREFDAKAMREKDPKMAATMLKETRKKVEVAGLEPASRDQLLRRLDRSIAEMDQYIKTNGSKIELQEKNDKTRQDLTRENTVKLQTQQKLAELADQYNRLTEEQRFEEAEVIAKKAAELAPKEPVTQVMLLKSKFARNVDRDRRIRESKGDNIARAFQDVDLASDPGPGDDYAFPDVKNWKSLTSKRVKQVAERNRRHRTDREIEIEKKLQTPVLYSCHNRPLGQVLEQLAKYADINIHLDEEGLRQEGLSPDTPVTLELAHEIQLKSYLNLLLEQRNLCYIIKHEVLNITSDQKKTGQVYTQTYPVGDLVLPIPNFVANPRMGLAGALHDAMNNAVGAGGGFGTATTPMAVVASHDGKQNNSSTINPAVMANMAPRLPGGGGNVPLGGGAGGAGGGSSADFDSLIDLITQTVSPKTWDHNGGQGNVAAAPTNLSLVVSQTQEVHEEIVDLLEQLRRMQDLQVTIEVRFITLNDQFFERIGVDFDFNIQKNNINATSAGFSAPQNITAGGSNFIAPLRTDPNAGTAVVGLQAAGNNPAKTGIFTSDLGIPVNQGSYALAVPQFGGFDAAAGATVGFAILSDIEAFFFVNAAAGDKRTNILQAPKVTLFNGQQAFVSDTSQTPFVISVIPVVGDFAAAQQPVIVVLSEGTFMTVQAVVSNDRRFVRLTIVPFFSKIGKVDTFTFQGNQTTTTDTTRNGGVVDQAKNVFNNNRDTSTTTNSGVTVQLPTFSFVTVTTTVSVPDGGTVLLGGIKRLSEGRNEFGVPILDKVPYLNRLFKNVGIGRETSSLMMMVTPRIIIQEEEEDKMGVQTGP